MTIVSFPSDCLAAIEWQHEDGRPVLQKSAWTGKTREFTLGPGARWRASAAVVPMWNDAQRRFWAGFEAAAQVPGTRFRLPAIEASQFDRTGLTETLVANGAFTGGIAPWQASGGSWPVQALTQADGAPVPQCLLVGVQTAALLANAAVRTAVSVLPNGTLWLSAWVRASFTGSLSLQIYWYDSGGTFISNAGLSLAPTTPNVWEHRQGSVTPPLGAVTFQPRIDAAISAGYAQVGAARVSSWPWRAAAASGSSGRTLNLSGLGPGLGVHLMPGHLVTVELPSGDEQLVRLTSNLSADGGGLGSCTLATPLREAASIGARVYLAEPYGLMRAVHVPGWGVGSDNTYRHGFEAEEAF